MPARISAVNFFSFTSRAPWTPLPRRFGAYSDRSTCLSHSITLKHNMRPGVFSFSPPPVVSPEHNVRVNYLTVSLTRSSPPLETGGLEIVLSQHLDSSPDGQMMELVRHF